MAKNKIIIDGFRMHQSILNEFRFIRDESFSRPPASSYVVYLTMLKQLDVENNSRGILREYNLSYWSKKLNISYSTLYSGKCWLEKNHFIKDTIDAAGMPVTVMKDVEKYNKPEEGHELNYLLIPHALLETNILAEFVRTSNPEAIELLFSLLNQFRTGLSKMEGDSFESVKMSRTMNTLKEQLNKNAKGVRQILSILESLFHVQFEGLTFRGKQMWVRKIWISLKAECVVEKTDEFQVDQLMAMLSHELTYFLDGLRIKYKPRDQRDVMIAFNQEVIKALKYLKDEKYASFNRDHFIKHYFLECIDNIAEQYQQKRKETSTYKWHSIGAVFRIFFRNNLKIALEKIPYGIVHDAKVEAFSQKEKILFPI
ncbi:hypothetical protein [Niallia sp. NCCP-28]|uniref:hypothetical protein n=1 Tax=Niallia sp. NCCP-28 TaxID=2934712 RepID=UPI00208437F0|nr:hypothetical protein [Niallia sp. NCCP-28]GKU83928.1 hypothetical protein NCCP28_33240 [Niallia sp. NCCP-28]